jgi:hypothetical protein
VVKFLSGATFKFEFDSILFSSIVIVQHKLVNILVIFLASFGIFNELTSFIAI